jgi:hypothetical protein
MIAAVAAALLTPISPMLARSGRGVPRLLHARELEEGPLVMLDGPAGWTKADERTRRTVAALTP